MNIIQPRSIQLQNQKPNSMHVMSTTAACDNIFHGQEIPCHITIFPDHTNESIKQRSYKMKAFTKYRNSSDNDSIIPNKPRARKKLIRVEDSTFYHKLIAQLKAMINLKKHKTVPMNLTAAIDALGNGEEILKNVKFVPESLMKDICDLNTSPKSVDYHQRIHQCEIQRPIAFKEQKKITVNSVWAI